MMSTSHPPRDAAQGGEEEGEEEEEEQGEEKGLSDTNSLLDATPCLTPTMRRCIMWQGGTPRGPLS